MFQNVPWRILCLDFIKNLNFWILSIFLGYEWLCCHHSEVYFYSPDTDIWSFHRNYFMKLYKYKLKTHECLKPMTWNDVLCSNLPYSDENLAVAIITQKSGERWIIVKRPNVYYLYVWSLTNNTKWINIGDDHGYIYHARVMMVSLDPYTAYMLG